MVFTFYVLAHDILSKCVYGKCPIEKFIEELPSDDAKEVVATMNWRLLYVVYTMFKDDIFRIISARPITRNERQQYEEQ